VYDNPDMVLQNLEDCEDGTTGKQSFNLNDAVTNADGGTVSFYSTLANANAGTSGIASPSAYSVNIGQTTLWARVDNSSDSDEGCYSVGSFTIDVNPLPRLTSPLTIDGGVCSNQQFTYTPEFSESSNGTWEWSRAEVEGIRNPGATEGGRLDLPRDITETLENVTNAPIDVVYEYTLTSAEGCSNVYSVTVTVNPTPEFDLEDEFVICEGEIVTLNANPGLLTGLTYVLTYDEGAYNDGTYPDTQAPTAITNQTGEFSLSPVVGVHTYVLTVSNDYCAYSKVFTVKVFPIPFLNVSPSCFERAVTVSSDLEEANFTGGDRGTVEYYYENRLPDAWTTEETWTEIPYQTVTVHARNTAYPDAACEAVVTVIIGLETVESYDVSICQDDPVSLLHALALCYGWSNKSHVKDVDPQVEYNLEVDPDYPDGVTVNYGLTDIFKVDEDKPQVTFNDCNNKDIFSYSLYEYPFNPANPSVNFVTFIPVGAACNSFTLSGLNPDKYYQLVVNDYDPSSGETVNIQFNQSDKADFLEGTANDIHWYDENMNPIFNGTPFDPVANGDIPSTSIPGDWTFFVNCGDDPECNQEVHYRIYPRIVEIETTIDENVICSTDEVEIELVSYGVDAGGNPYPITDPAIADLITYTWSAEVVSGDNTSVEITPASCATNCGDVISAIITNDGTTEVNVRFTITATSDECSEVTKTIDITVQPEPTFEIVNNNDVICPSEDPQIDPIRVNTLTGRLIEGLIYKWYYTIPAGVDVTAVPASGETSNVDFDISGVLVSGLPRQIQTVQLTVEAWVNGHNCVSKTTTLQVGDNLKPEITCPTSPSEPFDCYEDLPAPATDYDSFVDIGGWADDNCTKPPFITYEDDLEGTECNGVITRTYRAKDYAGNINECTQQFTITAPPLEVTVDQNEFEWCVTKLFAATYDGVIGWASDIQEDRPDYYDLTIGDKEMLDNNVHTGDVCTTTNLQWSLYAEDPNNPGQPGTAVVEYLSGGQPLVDQTGTIASRTIRLMGADSDNDDPSFPNKHYYLIYELVDDCNNVSEPATVRITITPRPQVLKVSIP
ncbi:PKD-like domain-containing protein, partial [Sunxiuqinia rutila]|uniref:PKD-like domain-containing protein n=1 Tax=Sunxiuqinia rutila TaxID=1397841 RepID=UPI003D36AB90